MGKQDPRVDAYIARSADFAKPILKHLRKIVHEGCPDVEETLKWGHPSFMHKGILAGMAAFTQHAVFGFWKDELMTGKGRPRGKGDEAMGNFGRLASLSDLPGEKTLVRLVKEAVALNDKGVKLPSRSRPKNTKKTLVVPDALMSALRKNKKALATFDGFNYSSKKDYVEWVTEAKWEETRKRRLDTAVAWMAEAKVRNWKYIKK